MNDKYKEVIEELGEDRVLINEPLSKYSHIKIGGPADLFFIAESRDDLVRSVQVAIKNDVPFTILGWGSNSLISDKGIRGLVIKNEYKDYKILEELGIPEEELVEKDEDARQVEWRPALTYDFTDLNYVEKGVPEVLVRVSSGYDLPVLITKTLMEGITGLHWFSGIPGTVAGAVYNNIHGGKKLIGPMIESSEIIDAETGELKTVGREYFGFAYDESRMHANNDVLIEVVFRLKRGNVEKAKYVRTEWAKRKSVQPQNSLGCTYANPPQDVIDKMGYPTPSVGYFVEHIMGWKKKNVLGGVSMGRENGHAAFVCNENGATAQDYIDMMKRVFDFYKKETGYELRPEIFFLGEFEENPFKKDGE